MLMQGELYSIKLDISQFAKNDLKDIKLIELTPEKSHQLQYNISIIYKYNYRYSLCIDCEGYKIPF